MRRQVSFKLDEEAIELARECAEERGISLSRWLAWAAHYISHMEEGRRDMAEILAEFPPNPEAEQAAEEFVDSLGIPKPIPYTPSGPFCRVTTMLDEKLFERVRLNAQHAGLSIHAWLARAAWFHTQSDPRALRQERRSSGRLHFSGEEPMP